MCLPAVTYGEIRRALPGTNRSSIMYVTRKPDLELMYAVQARSDPECEAAASPLSPFVESLTFPRDA